MEHNKIMKLLINDKEIAHYLASLLDPHQYANEVNFNQSEIAGVINYMHGAVILPTDNSMLTN